MRRGKGRVARGERARVLVNAHFPCESLLLPRQWHLPFNFNGNNIKALFYYLCLLPSRPKCYNQELEAYDRFPSPANVKMHCEVPLSTNNYSVIGVFWRRRQAVAVSNISRITSLS